MEGEPRRHLLALAAAFTGSIFGGALLPVLFGCDSLVVFFWAVIIGALVGTLPGWTCGLLTMLAIEKNGLDASTKTVPAVASFLGSSASTALLYWSWT